VVSEARRVVLEPEARSLRMPHVSVGGGAKQPFAVLEPLRGGKSDAPAARGGWGVVIVSFLQV
jgi:hypothetical protein